MSACLCADPSADAAMFSQDENPRENIRMFECSWSNDISQIAGNDRHLELFDSADCTIARVGLMKDRCLAVNTFIIKFSCNLNHLHRHV